MSEQAMKFDQGKARWDLLPFDALDEVAKVLTFGASKYQERNWEKGLPWMKLVASTFRHLKDWILVSFKDEESGLHPLAHCACDVLFLLAFCLRNTPGDDRPLKI